MEAREQDAPVALAERPAASRWEPETPEFWSEHGAVAWRNLAISVPCLLLGFAVWIVWSVVTVQMKNLGFPFTDAQLFTLGAVAGLTGATLRIPNAFMVAVAGGRNVVALTTGLLLVPVIGMGLALQSKETPFEAFVALAALCGVGGGNFASSMSNISFFFPKRMQGLALGVNAGFGNLGVSLTQVLVPAAMSVGLFGAIGGAAMVLPRAVGALPAGTHVWIQNAGWGWVPILLVATVLATALMTNLPIFGVRSTARALASVVGLELIGFAGAAVGLYLLIGLGLSVWIVLPATILAALAPMKLLRGDLRARLDRQFAIFRSKHNWVMSWLYVMTFGSFIGYSMALPLLIRVVFGKLPDGSPNPDAPNPFAYAWLGPLVGSLVRPVGGWLSDRLGGARVTQWATVVMIAAAVGAAFFLERASGSAAPQDHFLPFLGAFLVLFVTTGIGNGSTFRMVPIIFKPEQAGPVLGWTSALAAYGAFVVPRVFASQVDAGTPWRAFYGFAVYYASCLLVNWWFYARKGAEIPC